MKLKSMMALATLLFAACDNDSGVELDGGAAADMNVAASPASVTLTQTNLVGDSAGATHTDPLLVNAWGLAFGPTGVAWVASNGSGVSQLYDATGALNAVLPTVTIPATAGATEAAKVTGMVFNGNPAVLRGDLFLFATEDGTIAGWRSASGTMAVIEVDNSAGVDHPIYKGLGLATSNGATRLFAADFHNGKVDVFDANFAPVTLPGAFLDTNLPAGFAPFNVQAMGPRLCVSYAKQGSTRKDDVAGAGSGFINTFDFNGGSQTRLISGGALNSPWGMALAPANFGDASGALLVGNFGDGQINAFHPTTGVRQARFVGANGAALQIDGLWSLVFGSGTLGEAQNQLFFTAGPAGETHGLFGRLEIRTMVGPLQ